MIPPFLLAIVFVFDFKPCKKRHLKGVDNKMIYRSMEEQQRLLDVAMGRKAPSVLLTGGEVLDVYTGRLQNWIIALAGRWIAYVGPKESSGLLLDDSMKVVDLSGRVVVPGYIEPHAHPFQIYNPLTLAEKAGACGTTTLVHDNLFFFAELTLDEMEQIFNSFKQIPIKQFWWARVDAQTYLSDEKKHLFRPERILETLKSPHVIQMGELTDWIPMLAGDEGLNQVLLAAREQGKRVESHAPGASWRTLSRLAAMGVTGDHESISAEEVWRRLSLGYMVTLRHSSIRPDLPELMKGLLDGREIPWHRMMMTTDGATPLYFENGFTDVLIREAIAYGCDPIAAYQMVTINPAVYFRMDEVIGGIAPGRLADLNILASLKEPRPLEVWAEGEKIAENGHFLQSFVNPSFFSNMHKWKAHFVTSSDMKQAIGQVGRFPVIEMMNSVITKLTKESINLDHDVLKQVENQLPIPEDCHMVLLVDKNGKWITPAIVRGFATGIDGIASSYNGSNDLLIMGRSLNAMERAAQKVIEQQGGICWIQGDQTFFNLPLPILGKMSDLSMEAIIEKLQPFNQKIRSYGYKFEDPIYTFLFLPSTHLPQVRLTAAGLMRVKDKSMIYPSVQCKINSTNRG